MKKYKNGNINPGNPALRRPLRLFPYLFWSMTCVNKLNIMKMTKLIAKNIGIVQILVIEGSNAK
jgi:hypothetical protein